MSTSMKLNVLFLGIIAVCIGVNWFGGRDYTKPNIVILPEMMYSVPYDAYQPNPVFANGQTLQTPVEGTIARGYMPDHYAATPEEATRAGLELKNPFASGADNDVLARGRQLFTAYCAACHGSTGLGDGKVAKRGFPPPPSLLADNAMAMLPGQMYHIITYGQGNMPLHATQVQRADRWKIVSYITESIQQRDDTK